SERSSGYRLRKHNKMTEYTAGLFGGLPFACQKSRFCAILVVTQKEEGHGCLYRFLDEND
ncbi:MAG: hypothetical protein J5845_04355, partial [Lachnospiraceae bacterium]|nr:hypothetical protein [Lachnospiraceae bacterium]